MVFRSLREGLRGDFDQSVQSFSCEDKKFWVSTVQPRPMISNAVLYT